MGITNDTISSSGSTNRPAFGSANGIWFGRTSIFAGMLGSALAMWTATIAGAGGSTCWSQWDGNGHFYLPVYRPAGVTWFQAEEHAVALGGHLASIGSAAENTFVFNLVSDPIYWTLATNPTRILGPWLGGHQPPGTVERLGGWSWSSGEAWGYSNWAPNEPNNLNGNEDHLQFYTHGTVTMATWNDLIGSKLMLGYVIELEVEPPAQPADLTCDATVDASDLGVLIAAWGESASDADIDGDGVVGSSDLGLLLAAWGWGTGS